VSVQILAFSMHMDYACRSLRQWHPASLMTPLYRVFMNKFVMLIWLHWVDWWLHGDNWGRVVCSIILDLACNWVLVDWAKRVLCWVLFKKHLRWGCLDCFLEGIWKPWQMGNANAHYQF
jgi:hypothetical protein